MLHAICTVYDTKAQAHLQPATFRTVGEGIRAFEGQCKNPESMFSKHPSDFVFKKIADFDELSGVITPVEPTILATAADYAQA